VSTPERATRRRHRRAVAAVAASVLATIAFALVGPALAGCATSAPATGGAGVVNVLAAENFWASLARQLGGSRVRVTSVINNPDADPHDYEPTAADARAVAASRLVLLNGAGYDAWADALVNANPDERRAVIKVAELAGVRAGDNPHLWYSPTVVRSVIDRITAAYKQIAPADAAFFDTRHETVTQVDLKRYFGLIDGIRNRYAGTPVGASESIFAMLAPALGLDLRTPSSFLTAVTEGADPAAADKAAVDAQIKGRQVKVYVYNTQNTTPDVRAQVDAAKAAGIPVVAITETLQPAGASFQDWQVAQLTALEQALAQGTGR
jgi:zinc/manganese transport system substrate-binding protein